MPFPVVFVFHRHFPITLAGFVRSSSFRSPRKKMSKTEGTLEGCLNKTWTATKWDAVPKSLVKKCIEHPPFVMFLFVPIRVIFNIHV